MEPIALHDGRILQVHEEDVCIGPHCCIHRPSDHPLKNAPLDWWQGWGMMRVCEHGFTHPDPDDLNVKVALHGIFEGLALIEAITSVHMMKEHCDGCCHRKEPDAEATEAHA